jgi:hypothetical protein
MAEQHAEEWTPRTWDELFPGRFLKHSHLNGREVEVTIERVYNTEIDGKLAQVARIAPINGVVQRDWGLNKTNGYCLRAMFGETIRDWFGKRVTLHESKVEHGREKGKPCIRICSSADIEKEAVVVIDFHTKRIKPFTIRIRPGMHAKQPAKEQASASPKAKELAQRFREAGDPQELHALALDVEACVLGGHITREESKALMGSIMKRSKEIAEKESADVIS